jgi:hypothetical protein
LGARVRPPLSASAQRKLLPPLPNLPWGSRKAARGGERQVGFATTFRRISTAFRWTSAGFSTTDPSGVGRPVPAAKSSQISTLRFETVPVDGVSGRTCVGNFGDASPPAGMTSFLKGRAVRHRNAQKAGCHAWNNNGLESEIRARDAADRLACAPWAPARIIEFKSGHPTSLKLRETTQ